MSKDQRLTQVDKWLRHAINEKKLIGFTYHGEPRIVEPHDYGIQNGSARLLVYQIGGTSNSGRVLAWRGIGNW